MTRHAPLSKLPKSLATRYADGYPLHTPQIESTANDDACTTCGRLLRRGRSYVFKVRQASAQLSGVRQETDIAKCVRCALRHRPLLRRSFYAALVVGTILTLLNQGDTLLAGDWSNSFYWKIPLTYSVPFIVSTYGALTNVRK